MLKTLGSVEGAPMEHVSDNAAISADTAAVAALTARFYDQAIGDPVIGPVIEAALPPGRMADHQAIFTAFWTRFLWDRPGYHGNAFAAHGGLTLEARHFRRWLEIFEPLARDLLPEETAARAIAQARHMSQCLQGQGGGQSVAWPLGRARAARDRA